MRTATALEDRIVAKVAWRILPLLAVLFVISYLDRVNVGFAALTMNADLGMSATLFGWGAGVFFFGYLLFQVPSNLMLERFGPRLWMAVIVLAWGAISASMGAIHSPATFLVARFFLGLAEAGFFPGVILYLTHWFPAGYRGRVVAGFMFAVPVSVIVGGPLSSLILSALDEQAGLAGWRWLFILEGAPALAGALALLLWLPDRPENAAWLIEDERICLVAALRPPIISTAPKRGVTATLLDPRVLRFCIIYFGIVLGNFSTSLWLPQIIQGSGASVSASALLTALPYVIAAIGMLLWGRWADARGAVLASSVWIPTFIAAVGLVGSATAPGLPLQLTFISLALIGVLAAISTFWILPTDRLAQGEIAVGVAMINATGNLGGFVGPIMIGWIKDTTGSFQLGLVFIAAWMGLSGLLLLRGGGLRVRDAGKPVPTAL